MSTPGHADPAAARYRGRQCWRSLGEDGFLYRFRQDARPLGRAEDAFLLCGFWMALAAHQQGATAAAARWFERNRAACGPPGLFAEEYDVAQRRLRGNLPQAFVHAVMLEAAVRLASPDVEWVPDRATTRPPARSVPRGAGSEVARFTPRLRTR